MKKMKWLKGLALSSFVGMTAVSLVACGPTVNATHAFTSNPTKVTQDNNSPLNGTFNNSPTSRYVQTSLYGLTTYQTTGQFKLNESGQGFAETTNDTLILEGASVALVFANENVMKDVDNKFGNNLLSDSTIDQSEILNKLSEIKGTVDKSDNASNDSSSETTDTNQSETKDASTTDTEPTKEQWKEGTDYWVFTRDKGGLQFQKGIDQTVDTSISQYYSDAISKGKVYQFVIDTDNWWVDANGTKQQKVSSKDFERGLETYALAAKIGYTRNSYFLDLIGLGADSLAKTVSYLKTDGKYANVAEDKDYNINDFANKNDAIYTLYIDEPYPYALDLISKEYFGALPNTNYKVQNISLSSDKIKLKSDGKIDTAYTQFNDLFGSGSLGKFTEDTWYAGAYYISAFTSSQIIFNINNTYMDTVGKYLLSYVDGKVLGENNKNTDSRMQQIVINYGSGSDDTYFENFKAGQIDYLATVPEAKRTEANSLRDSVVPIKIVQTTQSNYIAYTPNSYIVNPNGGIDANNFVPQSMAQFIYQWDNENAITIRAGIAGLINYYELANLVYSNSKDFQLSATPYGVFKNYYENVANDKFYGALPRPYSDYKNSSTRELSEFEIPYYSYVESEDKMDIKKIKINKDSFKKAISEFGGTQSKPLSFSIKFGEGSFSADYLNFLTNLEKSIENLSDGTIDVYINQRDGQNPSSNEWYNNQSSPLGYSYWSPDYNGVGTWIEADSTLESMMVNGEQHEGIPGTNAHNSFHTFLASMVYAVKMMNYTWNDANKKYEASTTSATSSEDPYKNDEKIQKAFSDDTLKAFNIETTDASFNSKNTPGERYGTIAIELLNLLIEKGVFNQTNLTKYINSPNFLLYSDNKPNVIDNLYLGSDVIKANQSANFSKYLGIFAGQSTAKALYENTVLDSDYSFIPRAEAGLNEKIISLVNPNYVARSGTQSVNYRDFGIKNK